MAVDVNIGVNTRAEDRETRINKELVSAVRDRMVNNVIQTAKGREGSEGSEGDVDVSK